MKNCLGCYTLIFSVMFVLFGACATGYWSVSNKLDDINKTLTSLSCSVSAHTGIPITAK